MSPLSFTHSLLRLIAIGIAYCVSFIFNVPFFGRIFYVGKIRLSKGAFAFDNCEYAKPGGTHVTIARLEFIPHLPRRSFPCWGVLKVYDYEYIDHDHHVTISTVNVTLWFFPVLSRITSGPWLTIHLGDFRTLVYTSERTPDWIVQIRENIFDTICRGEIIRLDDFKLRTTLSKPNPVTKLDEDEPECFCEEDEDDNLDLEGKVEAEVQLEQPPTEGVIDGYAIRWHMVNSRQRMFAFSDVVAQLRRDIDGDSGSYRMSSKDCRWIKVPAVDKQELYINYWHLISWKVLLMIAQLPFDLNRMLQDPMSAVDIIVSSCDITFDHFRLRDAELGTRLETMLKNDYTFYSRQIDVDELLADMFIAAAATLIC